MGVFGFHLGPFFFVSFFNFQLVFLFTITDFGDTGSAAGGRVESAGFFLGLFELFVFRFFVSTKVHFLVFFYLGFFYDNGLITDFGDDGGVADGRVKSAGFFWGYLFFLLIYFGQL